MSPVLAVIPARYNSTRFPGKALATLGDKTMLEVVWRAASRAVKLERLIVATDDERIAAAATGFQAEVMMTSASHPSGTDRVAEVVARVDSRFEVVLNIQGDEPLLSPSSLDRLVDVFDAEHPPQMATLAEPIVKPEQLFDPNVVKVVTAEDGRALYFSRSPIPFHRGSTQELSADFRQALSHRTRGLTGFRKHQGIYAYRTRTLLALTRRGPSPLELDEGLEQLRALEAGYSIRVVDSDFRSHSVDTPADLERVHGILMETN